MTNKSAAGSPKSLSSVLTYHLDATLVAYSLPNTRCSMTGYITMSTTKFNMRFLFTKVLCR